MLLLTSSSSQDWTSQINYESVASITRASSARTVLICFYPIDTKDNGSLEVPHACIDDDRYDMAAECGVADQLLKPKMGNSIQLRSYSFPGINTIHLHSTNMILYYSRRV